jgi:outer membrane lipoprotein-sorting protein
MSIRTISTRQLLVWAVAIVGISVGVTAIALAATGGGPVPPQKPLDVAVHDSLAAPPPVGIMARVKFTNHLINSSGIEGGGPVLTGASGRLWATKGHLRLELQSDRGDAQLVADDKTFWAYDPGSNTVYRGAVPQELESDRSKDSPNVPSLAQVRHFIQQLTGDAKVSGAVPDNVAGHPAYTVRVSPRQNGGLVGAGELAWDAARGVPLRVGVYATGRTSPVVELTATDVSYGSVPASDFDVSPPPDAKVVQVSTPSKETGGGDKAEAAPVTGAGAVDRAVPFKLSAPDVLAGLPRHEVRLLDSNGDPGALVTYGRDLGGIAVFEQPADSVKGSGGTDHGDLQLPTISIDGVQAQELQTPLGTVIRFERNGVAFTVAGSVPAAKTETAARQL